MSRMRVLKPEFFSDSSVVRCSPLARLLFAGSWVFADDNGILPDDMLQLKMQALPGDNVDCEELKCEIVEAGLWVPFLAGDRRWLLIRSFARHQTLDRPSPTCPLPDDDTIAGLGLAVVDKTYTRHGENQVVRVLVVDRSTTVRRPFDDRSSTVRLERKGIEEKGKEGISVESDDDSPSPCPASSPEPATNGETLTALEAEVVAAWNGLGAPFAAVRRVGNRRRHLKARLADGWWRTNWQAAIARVCSSAGLAGKNDRGWIADFDWFLKPGTAEKLLEGKYDSWGKPGVGTADDTSWLNVGLEDKR